MKLSARRRNGAAHGLRPSKVRPFQSELIYQSADLPLTGCKHYGLRLSCKKCLFSSSTSTSTGLAKKHAMHTRSITASACRYAVFNTLELLENIILQLPEQDIITARGINQHFNALVMTSPRIQRKLFLQPQPTKTTWLFDSDDQTFTPSGPEAQNTPGLQWTIPAKLNPILFAFSNKSARVSLAERVKSCEPIKLVARPDLSRLGADTLQHRMFVSQPPSAAVTLEFVCKKLDQKKTAKSYRRSYGAEETVIVSVKVENKTGVTFGDVMKEVRAELGLSRSGAYSVRAQASTLWIGGVVFPTAKEIVFVEEGRV